MTPIPSQVPNRTDMSTAQSPRIFRPWADEEVEEQKKNLLIDDCSQTKWRVPPAEWCGAVEQYWAWIASARSSPVSKPRPKRFRCPHCDVAFSNNGQLKGHVRIHTGERPFKCEAEGCGKSFTRNEELTRHKRIHSGVRPYPCQECGKTFGRKDHLKKHTRTHLPSYHEVPPQVFVYPYLYGY